MIIDFYKMDGKPRRGVMVLQMNHAIPLGFDFSVAIIYNPAILSGL
jgi:hypothetical protein